jgi:nucleoside-diphosphate-sugar epimerase
MVKKRMFFFIGKPGAIATYVHAEDVVSALVLCGLHPNSRGEIYNLSSDCVLEEFIGFIAFKLGINPPRLRFPEVMVRSLILAFDLLNIRCPLTTSRLNSLICRTTYPSQKIIDELGFIFSKELPASLDEIVTAQINKWSIDGS